MMDVSQVVVNGLVFVSTSTLWQSRRCWGGLLSLCLRNEASSFRPSRSYVGRPLAASSSFQLQPWSSLPDSVIFFQGNFRTMLAGSKVRVATGPEPEITSCGQLWHSTRTGYHASA